MTEVTYLNEHKKLIVKDNNYFIYLLEVKSLKKILRLEIRILKSNVNSLLQVLIKNQINNLIKIYPSNYFKKLRSYLKSKGIPFITKFPLVNHEGFVVSIFDSNKNSENYYENSKGDRVEISDDMLEWVVFDGNLIQKKRILKIIK
jgi:hypothetical protein